MVATPRASTSQSTGPVVCPVMISPASVRSAVQRVGGHATSEATGDQLRRQAIGLARRLVLEARDEFAGQPEPRVPREHVGAEVSGNLLGPPTRDVHAGRELQE